MCSDNGLRRLKKDVEEKCRSRDSRAQPLETTAKDSSLPGELHQVGVQGNGHEEVAKNLSAERVDGDEEVDAPENGSGVEENNDHSRGDKAEDEGALEVLDNLGDFLEEGGVFGFLARRTPGHVDGEHV